jgi:hypothetical protein
MTQFARITIDHASLADVQLLLSGIKSGYPKAMSRAINKGLATARVEARKKVQEEVTASTKYVNRAFVENKATYSKLEGLLVSAGIPVPLIAYAARQTNKGVTVRINTSGSRVLWPHAFIAEMKNVSKEGEESEHRGVFWRKTKHPGKVWKRGVKKKFRFTKGDTSEWNQYRLHVQQQFGPSIPAIFERGPILEYVERQGGIAAEEELARQVELLLR